MLWRGDANNRNKLMCVHYALMMIMKQIWACIDVYWILLHAAVQSDDCTAACNSITRLLIPAVLCVYKHLASFVRSSFTLMKTQDWVEMSVF